MSACEMDVSSESGLLRSRQKVSPQISKTGIRERSDIKRRRKLNEDALKRVSSSLRKLVPSYEPRHNLGSPSVMRIDSRDQQVSTKTPVILAQGPTDMSTSSEGDMSSMDYDLDSYAEMASSGTSNETQSMDCGPALSSYFESDNENGCSSLNEDIQTEMGRFAYPQEHDGEEDHGDHGSSSVEMTSTPSAGSTSTKSLSNIDVIRMAVLGRHGDGVDEWKPIPGVMDRMSPEDTATEFKALQNSERCSSCSQAMVLIENSGLMRCMNKRCRASGRRIFVTDGDMASLPFAADAGYKTMSLSKVESQVCESDLIQAAAESSASLDTIMSMASASHIPLPGNISLFNSLQRGQPTLSDGGRGSSENAKENVKDGVRKLRNTDPQFKPVSLVFCYSQKSRNQNANSKLCWIDPYSACVSPSIILYVQATLCNTLCTALPQDHPHSECAWKKKLNLTDIHLVVAKLAQEDPTGQWKEMHASDSNRLSILSQIYSYKPRKPYPRELDDACRRFVIATGLKDVAPIDFSTHAEVEQGDAGLGMTTKPIKKRFKDFLWSKIWQQIYGDLPVSQYFAIPPNPLRLGEMDAWWKGVCSMCGWSYTATEATLISSKTEVRPADLDFYYEYCAKNAVAI